MNVTLERSLVSFTRIVSTSPTTHTSVVIVPGHDAAQYEVIVRRASGAISAECGRVTPLGIIPCKGNAHSLCYHSRIAIMRVAHEAGYSVAFCRTSGDAILRSRLGGSVVRVTSTQSGATRFAVVCKVAQVEKALTNAIA